MVLNYTFQIYITATFFWHELYFKISSLKHFTKSNFS
jgi:hypothetical protein